VYLSGAKSTELTMEKIIVLHGAIGSTKQMQPIIQQFEKSYEVHTFNFIGHGGTALPESLTMEMFVEQLQEFVISNKLQQAKVFAYSMGGYVALALESKHPGTFAKIFTFATKWDWNADTAPKEAAMLNPEKIKEKVPAFAEYLSQQHGQDWEQLLRLVSGMMIQLGNSPLMNQEAFKKVEIPVCVSVGDRDTMVTLQETLSVYSSLKNGGLHVFHHTAHPFEKANHQMIYEVAERFFSVKD
jgi:pimeloyl-ACP methyl ester carboxylesterase